ncbi:MAG: Alanine racemase, partial [Candidatus Magasanikbacteria bacterium]|nr:Alanine racemase [Candidatus Magasanikbacteria bacterium]
LHKIFPVNIPKSCADVRTWIEIDGRALAQNLRSFRLLLGQKIKIMAVVKSNAYGHGLYTIAPLLQKLGVDSLAVDSLVEARALRRANVTAPMLVLGYTLPNCLKEATAKNVSVTISSFEQLAALAPRHFNKPLRTHIKVDTGLHRQGFLLTELPRLLKTLHRYYKKIIIEGLYSHLASATDPSELGYARQQINDFKKAIALFNAAGLKPITHLAATDGALCTKDAWFDMVRLGIGLYGLWPSPQTRAKHERHLKLTPVLAWRTIISEIKRLPVGARIGYEGTETLKRSSYIAVCPIGYWHGYPRLLSSRSRVLVRGAFCKLLGRVSMDMITIDVTHVRNVRAGDVVTLIGRDGKNQVTAEELAELSGTINYEIVTRVNPLIRRAEVVTRINPLIRRVIVSRISRGRVGRGH